MITVKHSVFDGDALLRLNITTIALSDKSMIVLSIILLKQNYEFVVFPWVERMRNLQKS